MPTKGGKGNANKAGSEAKTDMEDSSPQANNSQGTVTLETVMSKLTSIESQQTDFRKLFQTQIDSLKEELTKVFQDKIQALETKFEERFTDLENKYESLKGDLTQLQQNAPQLPQEGTDDPCEDTTRCIILSNLAEDQEGTLTEQVETLINSMDPELSQSVEVVATKRLPSRDENKPGLVKVALDNLESKKTLLRSKTKLRDTEHYKEVWMRGSMTHTERLLHLNFKKMLSLIPEGNNYRVSGSGRVIPKTQDEGGDQGATYANAARNRGGLGHPQRGQFRGRGRGGRGQGRGRGNRR